MPGPAAAAFSPFSHAVLTVSRLMSLLRRFFSFREQNAEAIKPFLDHLEDLRWMIIKIAVTLVAGMMLCFFFRDQLVAIVREPLSQIDPDTAARLQVLSVIEPFMISLKIAFYAGIILTFPILLFHIARFVIPALTMQEKKLIFPAIFVGFGLFILGVSFCYFWILPGTLEFFFDYSKDMGVQPNWRAGDYFSFVTQILIAFGLAFELPVAVLALNYLGLVTAAFLRRTRMFAYVLVLVFAAVIAPTPDPFVFLALGIPMCILYEACIWLAVLVERRRLRARAIEA